MGFCEKLVHDTRRGMVGDKLIKYNYIAEREEDDDRVAFHVPSDFFCKFHITEGTEEKEV